MYIYNATVMSYTGHVSCAKYTVSDTLFYNVTGTINARVEHARDILDTESRSYQEITVNLTRGVTNHLV